MLKQICTIVCKPQASEYKSKDEISSQQLVIVPSKCGENEWQLKV